MNHTKITVQAIVNAEIMKVWDYYTNPLHIVNWNFADPSWHCPKAENNLNIGGIYKARMEAKDGSFGFDFEAIYTEITFEKSFTYEFDNRVVNVILNTINNNTEIIVTFDPENENPIDLQTFGWQSILNNFKKYTENN